MAYYKDGTASDITNSCTYDPAEGTLLEYAGELNINAGYTDHAGNEFAADTQIIVYDVEELLFTGLQNETQKEGAGLDLSGPVISARYTDGTIRTIDATSVVLEPAAGELIGHMDTMTIQAMWKNPATGSEYYAEHTINVDAVEGIFFSHSPNKSHYAEGEPLDLTGSVVSLRYKRSGDIVTVTPGCTFYPPAGEIMTPYGTSLHATYQMPSGDQYECETLLNVTAMTIPIDEIGPIIGGDLGLSFNDDLPSDFWDGFYPQDVPYIPADGDYFITTDTYSSIVDYLAQKGAFADYSQYGDIPYMKLPAGRYPSRNAGCGKGCPVHW